MKASRGLFEMYFIRIVCIMLLPILILGSVFAVFYSRQLRQEIENDVRNIGASFQSAADRILDAANSTAIQMAMQLEKSKLFTLSLNYEQEINELAGLRAIMETACALDNTIELFGLRQSKGKVLCQQGYYDILEYRDLETIRKIERMSWQTHMLADADPAGGLTLAFYYTVPLYQRGMNDYVYVKVSTKAMQGLLSGIAENACFIISNESGVVLLSAGDGADSLSNARLRAGSVTRENGYYSHTTRSSAYPFLYTVLRAEEYVHRNAVYMSVVICAVFLVIALLGILCAWMLAKRLSLPIYSLVYQLQERLRQAGDGGVPAEKMDELTYLFETMDKLIKNEDALMRALNDRKQRAIHSLLRHALEGDYIDAEELASLATGFAPSCAYVAIALDTQKSPQLTEPFNGVSAFQLAAAMNNGLKEALNADAVYALIMPGGKLCGVIGAPNLDESALCRALNQLWNQLNDVLTKAPLVIGYGHAVDSLAQLNLSYLSAKRALKRVSDLRGGVAAPEACEERGAENQNARECERLVSLVNEDPQQAREFVDELRANRFGALDANELREYCLWLLARCVFRLEEKNAEVSAGGGLYQRVRQLQCADDARELLRAQIDMWAMEMEEQRAQRMTALIVQTVKYMEENYASDISLTELADRLDVSPQHLSACFRKQMNATFTDYLSQLRLKKARELILNTRLPVNRVAELCGYNSPQYFIRRFKEAYGVSPSKYKN